MARAGEATSGASSGSSCVIYYFNLNMATLGMIYFCLCSPMLGPQRC